MSVLLAIAFQAATQRAPSQVEMSQAQLNVMTDACKAPRKWLRHMGGDEVRFEPSPTGKYKTVNCVLKRLRASMAPMKLGFIGNEQLSEDK
jgi:hypothetical protein